MPIDWGEAIFNTECVEGHGKKNLPLYLCSPFADAALVKGNFKTIVMLPKYVDIMEWVAVNSELEHFPMKRTPTHKKLSVRFLYQLERVLWLHRRIVHSTVMSDHGRWSVVSDKTPWRRVQYLTFYLYSLNYMWTTRQGKQVSLPAPTYIDYVVTSVQQLLEDENVFPHNASESPYTSSL